MKNDGYHAAAATAASNTTKSATNAELHQRKNAATPRGVGVMCDFY